MKYLLIINMFALSSCAVVQPERKPIPPQGSDESDKPWSKSGQSEGGGLLGPLLNR